MMRKYLSFFRLRFVMGLQYRAAALAGIVTQFAWGFLEILAFKAFYESDAAAFPMELSAMSSYIWMQQAFLAFFDSLEIPLSLGAAQHDSIGLRLAKNHIAVVGYLPSKLLWIGLLQALAI